MRVVWVSAGESRTADIVLTVALDGRRFILAPEGAAITTDMRANDLRPLVSLNCRSLSLHWSEADGDTADRAVERFEELFGMESRRAA